MIKRRSESDLTKLSDIGEKKQRARLLHRSNTLDEGERKREHHRKRTMLSFLIPVDQHCVLDEDCSILEELRVRMKCTKSL